MEYNVIFIRQYEYIVEAENEEDAFKKGHEEFISECYTPFANTSYDDIIIEEIEGEN
jgi:hypothetical protein